MKLTKLLLQEEQNRGKPNWEHLNDELHVLITVEDSENRAKLKLERAVEEVKKLLTVVSLNYAFMVNNEESCKLFDFFCWQKTIQLGFSSSASEKFIQILQYLPHTSLHFLHIFITPKMVRLRMMNGSFGGLTGILRALVFQRKGGPGQ